MRVLALIVVLAFVACGGSVPVRKPAGGILVLKCDLPEAEIWLDSKYFREVAETTRGVRLPAGTHRLEVRHPDYHSMYYEVELVPEERRVIEVQLAPLLR